MNFQKGNERKREFRAAEIRFYLHKLFARPRSGFYLHKLSVSDLEESDRRYGAVCSDTYFKFRPTCSRFRYWVSHGEIFPAARANWSRNPIRRTAYRYNFLLGTQTLKWGGRYDKKWRFSKNEFEFGWPDFSYTNFKFEGDVLIKSDEFQRRNLSSVGRILSTQT